MSLTDEIISLAQLAFDESGTPSRRRKDWRAFETRLSALESELNDLRRIQHANEPELEMPSPERMAALRARARIERTSALPCSNVSDWDGEDGG